MRRIMMLATLPLLMLGAPFVVVIIWHTLTTLFLRLFAALSMEIDFVNAGTLSLLSIGLAVLTAVPVCWQISDELRDLRGRRKMLKEQEAFMRWRIELELERKYAQAMRGDLPRNRAPVVSQ